MGKILYMGLLEHGHMNTGLNLRQELIRKYQGKHEIYFVVDQRWHKKLIEKDSTVKTLIYESKNDTGDKALEILKEHLLEVSFTIKDKIIQDSIEDFFKLNHELLLEIEPQINKFFEQHTFKLIIQDYSFPIPFLMNKGIPWVLLLSLSPPAFGLDTIPPFYSGLGVTDKHLWPEIIESINNAFKNFKVNYSNWLVKSGCRPLKKNYVFYESPYFNIFVYPEEINYISNDKRDCMHPNAPKFPGKWLRLDSSICKEDVIAPYSIPEDFSKLPGKLIYFSMGSFFSSNFNLMQRLLNLIAQIPHKFIVSKGSNGDKLKMSLNCIGENFLPQKSILKIVDLAIIHGGNNTLTECFHFGVPFIVLPIMGDQIDNARRIEETNYGYQLNPYNCTIEELSETIKKILNNDFLISKMKEASKRITNDNGLDNVCKEIIMYLDK